MLHSIQQRCSSESERLISAKPDQEFRLTIRYVLDGLDAMLAEDGVNWALEKWANLPSIDLPIIVFWRALYVFMCSIMRLLGLVVMSSSCSDNKLCRHGLPWAILGHNL